MSLPVKSLTATAALLAVLPLSACGMSVGMAEPETEQRSYTLTEKVGSLQVTGHTGDIEVVGADVSAVKVTERLRFTKNGRPTTRHEVAGGTFQASYNCPNNISFRVHTCEVKYRITAPRAVAATLRTDTGNITLDGLNGAVTARTNTGDIRGTALRPGASARISTRTDTGDVRLTLAAAPAAVSADVNTGQVRITVPASQKYDVTADTNTGRKRISVPTTAGAPHTIQAKSDTGDLTIATA
ncbi:hypothetical protein DZF91_20035 [Actinomadura logoneensis]|uniref:DUF4097 domain-containing protein n=1 Tax=Actinomadura logoneensis TaxID=2293572 RepID=A0A372JIQ7_9ACTN|nr:DUF4097 family beta strand repeat-containing protein [Actinomadura logoneensis]RFU39895.1 hypothetical protein DZF91_20035 [Actinomadura logoneensis]